MRLIEDVKILHKRVMKEYEKIGPAIGFALKVGIRQQTGDNELDSVYSSLTRNTSFAIAVSKSGMASGANLTRFMYTIKTK